MSPQAASILGLVAMFVIATALPINMGALAFAMAFLIGTTYVGMPMRSYLVRVRAGEAARRVLEGADDFAALALELGFYDHSHFTNAFVAVWGVTPSMFRESRRSIVRLRATTSKRLARRSS